MRIKYQELRRFVIQEKVFLSFSKEMPGVVAYNILKAMSVTNSEILSPTIRLS